MLGQYVILAGLAVHSQAASVLKPRSCDGETTKLFCYTSGNGVSQGVNTTDIAYIANYLRSVGRRSKAGELWTMKAADSQFCGEWVAYTRGGTQVAIKHIDDTIDSSVLYADIANTIDGGEKATAAQKAAAIISCGPDGGTMGVQVNATHPMYTSTTYTKAGLSPNGLLVKVTNLGEEEEEKK